MSKLIEKIISRKEKRKCIISLTCLINKCDGYHRAKVVGFSNSNSAF